MTEKIHTISCADIRNEESSRRLLIDAVTAYRELDPGLAAGRGKTVEQDIDRLSAGESIVWDDQLPIDYLKRGRILLGTIRTIIERGGDGNRISLLSEKIA